jgi:hypothetical protein
LLGNDGRMQPRVARPFAVPFALVWPLLILSLCAQDSARSEQTEPAILVDSWTPADAAELGEKIKILEAGPCQSDKGHMSQPTTVADFIGGKVKSIRLLRVAKFPTANQLRGAIRRVWKGQFQGASCGIEWAEVTFWSVEAVVEFDDGKRSALITDGTHVALQDRQGNSWFLRLLPSTP